MEDSGASFGVAKAMFWPRRLSTMTVMGDGEVVDAMLIRHLRDGIADFCGLLVIAQ